MCEKGKTNSLRLTANTAVGLSDSNCCGYGANGIGSMGYDCIMIPHATRQTTSGAQVPGNAFCGRSKGLAITNTAGTATATVSICCESSKNEQGGENNA